MTDVLRRGAERLADSARAMPRVRRRLASERRFRAYGIAATAIAGGFLAILLATIVAEGIGAFRQTEILLDVTFAEEAIDPAGTRDPKTLRTADYGALVKDTIRGYFPEVTVRAERKDLTGILSSGADLVLRDMVLDDPSIIGTTLPVWLPAADDTDQFVKGSIPRDVPEAGRRVNDRQVSWIDRLDAEGRIATVFNTTLFTAGDSREPELAGVWGAIVGSFYTMIITLAVAFPVGVATAIYLEEFAPKNRWTTIIEVNISNLAAVPSIVYGLLGLAIFLNFLGLPRSSPIVGGLVLVLMSLPIIIIAGRAALAAVPPSIREAAQGIGASPLQVVFHHVLPLAMPGILTGTIIGMAHALGETAPLLMIGMVAFVVDVPTGPTDAATVLPVQIFLWADSPERAFVERTAAAILVLLAFLMTMNAVAVFLRQRLEVKW